MPQLTEMTAVSAVSPMAADLPSAKKFPFKKFTFADGKILFCHLSDMNFADGQRRTCRLQIFCLPSANETFADGKCLAGRRQNSYRINGKYKFCHRQMYILPSANFSVRRADDRFIQRCADVCSKSAANVSTARLDTRRRFL
ncbi:MAG TPA: hypothetical protein IAA30_03050 [Candidatus Treponema faecavium]|nr:hypothetical protein [Candidatus Treponema faecavium]